MCTPCPLDFKIYLIYKNPTTYLLLVSTLHATTNFPAEDFFILKSEDIWSIFPSFILNNKNKEVLHMVESVLISKLPNFNLSSAFYTLPDNIARDDIYELHI